MSSSKTLSLLYSQSFLEYLSSLSVLVVGAGGIGCELLKIDLDTIEVSNLNRQFLFRKEHKGLSKAEVAKSTLEHMNPALNITAHQSNIKDFGVQFFKQFDVVFSALDNAEARSYLNTMCVALNKPLLEAGTTGFKGQAMLLKRGDSRCYDCEPKPANKTYQVCTIRTLPEKPLHCVIWAKFLFGVLFGPTDEANLLEDLRGKFEENKENMAESAQNKENIAESVINKVNMTESVLNKETMAESSVLNKENTSESVLNKENMSESVFNELFSSQIQKQIDSDPIKFDKLRPLQLQELLKQKSSDISKASILEDSAETKQKVFSTVDYAQLFAWSFGKLVEMKKSQGFVNFEKDDDICVKFVTAASNLRSWVFSIEMQNEFQVKEIAGNIIPAICSTNAIVAAIEVSESLKYLQFLHNEKEKQGLKDEKHEHDRQKCKNKECYVQNDVEKKINAINPLKPNPKCLVCNECMVPCLVFANLEGFTLGDFFERIVKRVDEKTQGTDNYTLMQQNLILFEQADYLEEDEIEANQKKLVQPLFVLFKGLKDVSLTLTLNETHFIKFSVIHDPSQPPQGFSLENDYIGRKALGDLKSLMVSNKMDYEEQMKREEEQKTREEEQRKENERALRENNGVFEIEDESAGEEGGRNGKDRMKSSLKRDRKNGDGEDSEVEVIGDKPMKQIKID